MAEGKKLYRRQSGRLIGGVCVGIGDYLAVDPALVRLAFVVLALVNGLGVLLYLILWAVMPDEATPTLSGEELLRANLNEMGAQARHLVQSMRSSSQGTVIVGMILMTIGLLFLLDTFVPWLTLAMLWPIALIAVGVYILLSRHA